jgi:hypothetical protein
LAAAIAGLHRRAFYVAIGTKDAAIAGLGPEQGAASFAVIEVLAGKYWQASVGIASSRAWPQRGQVIVDWCSSIPDRYTPLAPSDKSARAPLIVCILYTTLRSVPRVLQTETFRSWLSGLKDRQAACGRPG